jgi:hypothetical protein
MHKIFLLIASVGFVLALFISNSRGDVEPIDEPVDDTTEPITGEPVTPNPGSEQPMRDPFTPYDIGGAAAAWSLEDLTAEERVVVLRGIDDNQQEVQDAYAEAARDMATRARAQSAAIKLGIQQLGQIGVVP